ISAQNQEPHRRLLACSAPPFWFGRMPGSSLRAYLPASPPPASLKTFSSLGTPSTGVPPSLTRRHGCSKRTGCLLLAGSGDLRQESITRSASTTSTVQPESSNLCTRSTSL